MKLPDFSFEKELWNKGLTAVAGADEVGRGAFAGPVIAACVVFPTAISLGKGVFIHDSKLLTPKQRQKANLWIRGNCLTFGIGKAGVAQINKLGIKKATECAFRRAVISANKKMVGEVIIDHLLVDAFFVPRLANMPVGSVNKAGDKSYTKVMLGAKQTAIVKGDRISVSIAAASIVAKVYRDKLMQNLAKKVSYRQYLWDRNKGYGTTAHRYAIKQFGLTKHHRTTFIAKSLTS